MKPLSEKELRDKIQDIFNDCTSGWLITIKDFNGKDRSLESLENEIIDDILTLTIQDRKAWGEYVIGEDIDFPRDSQTGAPVGTDGFIGLGKSELRAEQRQRNQGEKTDE